ncbi:MAG: DUF7453 family protein, partial [Gemmataceae bacterium]
MSRFFGWTISLSVFLLATVSPAAAQNYPVFYPLIQPYVTPVTYNGQPYTLDTAGDVFVWNDSGTFSIASGVFSSTLGSPANNRMLWVGTPGNLNLIYQDQSTPAGLPTGVVIDAQFGFVQKLGYGGSVGRLVAVAGTGVDSTNDRAIVHYNANTTSVVARTGDAAPGFASGVIYSSFDLQPSISDTGRMMYRATLAGTGIITGENDSAIFTRTTGASTLVIKAGDAAPGISGATLTAVEFPLHSGNAGMVFRGTMTYAGVNQNTDNALWQGSPGNWSLIAREGGSAPGAGIPADAVFFNISTAEDLTLVNRRGDVLFTSAITGTGVTSVSNTGLWMKPVGGPLRKIIREGDQAAGLAPGINYRGTIGLLSFNNAGQTAFLTGLTDGVSSNVGSYAHYLVDADGTARMLARSGTQAPGTSAGVTYDFSTTTRTI